MKRTFAESVQRNMIEYLQAENDRLRAALEKVEWSKRVAFTDIMQCPICEEWPSTGHKADCFIATALRPEQSADDAKS